MDALPVRKQNTVRPAIIRKYLLHLGIEANLHALRLGGARHRLGDCPHAALRNAEILVGREYVAADVADSHDAPWRANIARVLRVYEAGAHQWRLEVLLHKVLHAAGEHALEYGFFRRTAQIGGDLGERGRISQEVTLYDATCLLPERHPVVVARAVRRRYARDALRCALVIVPAQNMLAARQRTKAHRVHLVYLKPVLAKFKVVDDLLLQHMTDIRTA